MSATRPHPARFFTTDPHDGALRDANGDGVPDGLRARLLLLGQPATDEWLALLDLAARLGLESGGIDLPLGITGAEQCPNDAAIIAFAPENSAAGRSGDAHWIVRGAAEVRALCQSPPQPQQDSDETGATTTASEPFDLARFYTHGGALAASEEPFCDRIRLCPVIPPDLPVEIGLALLDLAARLGLETGGVRFPLGIPEGDAVPPDQIPLRIAIESQQGENGEGLCSFVSSPGGGVELRVSGSTAGIAATLRTLAGSWPHLDGWDPGAPSAGDLTEELSATLRGEDARGRAALLAAALAAETTSAAHWGELRLLVDEPALAATATAWATRQDEAPTIVSAPDDRLAFVDEWSGEWERDRAHKLVAERLIPALDPALPAEVTILISEPAAIRRALAEEVEATLPTGSTVHVLSAFKAGLCWLTEIVTPRWQRREAIAQIVIAFRPFEPPTGDRFLDLSIRPLQELYPGDELLAAALGLSISAIALEADPALPATYRATAYDASGQLLDTLDFSPRYYDREYLTGHPEEGFVTVATGAIIATQSDRPVFDRRLGTDLDLIWDHYQEVVMPRVRAAIDEATGGAISPEAQPFFEALEIEAWVSETDEALGVREELLSSAEALHQDFYFGTLDAIAALGNAQAASGTLDGGKGGGALDAPGAIRPFVHIRRGEGPHLRVALRRRLRHLAESVAGEQRVPLGLLPTGPRLRPVVRSFRCDRQGSVVALGLELPETDTGTAAILRALATQEMPEARVAVEIAAGGETINLRLPIARSVRQVATTAPQELPAIAIDSESLVPQLERLAALPGVVERTVARSFEGRPLPAIELQNTPPGTIWSRRKLALFKPTLLIIARHHANEPASTHAALSLAERWATDPAYQAIRERINLAILPLENPDGAALHAAMREEHPTWKHHVARYNAVGREFARDYFDPEAPWGESRARPRLWHEWLPDVVMDNHGVPSHEWNQQFNGFGSPPRFGVSYWLVSALLYGILRYPTGDPAHAMFAEAVRERIAVAVGADPALAEGNAAARAVYERWGHRWLPERFPATYHREMLWYFGPQTVQRLSPHRPSYYDRVTVADIVTEVPDETAQGDYLALVAHAHLVANEALLALLADSARPTERTITDTTGGYWVRLARPRPLRV